MEEYYEHGEVCRSSSLRNKTRKRRPGPTCDLVSDRVHVEIARPVLVQGADPLPGAVLRVRPAIFRDGADAVLSREGVLPVELLGIRAPREYLPVTTSMHEQKQQQQQHQYQEQ